jgi:hypothetical protein
MRGGKRGVARNRQIGVQSWIEFLDALQKQRCNFYGRNFPARQ